MAWKWPDWIKPGKGPKRPKPVDPAQACKRGGHAGFVDPATGLPFADQGACVTFVRAGGVLKPVPPADPPAPVS